jgi:ribonuclease P/MRP protein subunit POP5
MVRRKQRYLIFKIRTEDNSPLDITRSGIAKAMHTPFFEMFGDFGAGSVLPTLRTITWLPEKGVGVFQVVRQWADNFKAMLEEMNVINNVALRITVVHVSGTIDQAQRWIDENPTLFE